jgi:hypothetical protein
MEGAPKRREESVTPRNEREPQPWLNMAREKAFQTQIAHFEKLDDAAVRDAFLTIFNPSISDGSPLLTTEDLRSLTYITVSSTGSSEIAEYEIKRPVFYFGNMSEFQKFYERIFGRRGSGGFHLPGSAFGEDAGIWNETGLMVTTNDTSVVTHEIRHTIDPYVGSRGGAHNMISEAFAYYQERILDVERGLVKLGDPTAGPWPRMHSVLTADIYYNEYFKTEDERSKTTYEEFKRLGSLLVSALQALHEKKGALEAQRLLVQAITIEQFLAYK